MEEKKLSQSKTVWANVAGLVVTALLEAQGVTLSAEQVAGLFAVANVLLRLVTKVPVRIPFRKAT